jgi:Leucine-rich repeat (LRR) protein
MLNKTKHILSLLSFLLLQGCNTYQTFYSETYTSVQTEHPKKVLRLDLSNQNLHEVPVGLQKFTGLKTLNLSKNNEIDLTSFISAIASKETLEVLILDNLALKTLPKNIAQLTNLKHLSLNGNPSLKWDETFLYIATLPIEFLNLQYNRLQGLPQEISEIKTIKDLNVSHNQITEGTTFRHLSGLPKLYSLWLSYNRLKQLPPEIGLLIQVKNLYLGNNQLESLPNEMKNMKQVWVIQAEHNAFKSLPKVFIEMPKLFSVHLNNCKINTISEAFATQKYSMKGLLLDNNNLSETHKKRWIKELNNFFLISME